MATVRSTLQSSQKYSKWENVEGVFVETFSKEINGGYGLKNKFMQSPNGAVLTTVTKEELDILKKIPLFQLHIQKGFIATDDLSDGDMQKKSKSSPLEKMALEKNGISVTVGDGVQ